MTQLGRKQREQTRRELDRDQRRKARARLTELRAKLKDAKARRRKRMHEVSCNCRRQRDRVRVRAKRARERLNASIKRTRVKAKELCGLARHDAHQQSVHEIGRAIAALNEEHGTQNTLRVWTAPPSRDTGRKRHEVRQESDDEVRGNIDDVGLRIVWEQVKGRIKPGARRSRTEAFHEWAAEHTSDVYRIQEADAERQIDELEREQRKIAKVLRSRRLLTAVPF